MKLIKKKFNRNNIKKFYITITNILIDIILIILYFFKKSINKKEFVIVTGADSNHFENLVNLLNSISLYEKSTITKVYNLGLSQIQINYLKNNFSNNFIFINFEFNNYPKFVGSIDSSGKLGSYAWKPIIIFNEYKNNKNLIWLDAGCEITKNLKLLKRLILKYGYFSPVSSNKVKDWTHPTTIAKLNYPTKALNKRNFQAGTLGFAVDSQVISDLISLWYEYSLVQEIISPKGSNRDNHRQDQAVLTLLLHLKKLSNLSLRTYKMFGIKIHQKNIKFIQTLND